MAQTQQPDDDTGAGANGRTGGTPRIPEPGSDAATTAFPPVIGAGGPHTPGRGTAAPLGTVGDGRYRLTHRLGRGGMAEVFAAEDVRLGRTVAVKLLRGELAQDDIARLRFTREAHAVAALNHHSIVAVYDTGEEYVGDESTPYIVMELVEGRTVRELLVDEQAPPVDQALIIIAGVLEALAYSHRHGIVHRDIKPANVIITTAGAVKVMDFGIARALTGTASTMTQTGMVMGTPQYLSPEQALGKPVDHRSDLYAAGCMLYELLTLRPPFTGDTPLSVVYQHVQDMPVPPSHANGRVPAGLDPLVLRSLAKNPDDRFQDADEFRAHIQHALREMHGAAGAGWAGAAAGLAAAGQGNTGATQVIRPDQTAATAAFGSIGPGDQTSMMPYPGTGQGAGGPHTPSTPYPGAGGPYGGGGEGDGGDGDGSGRRRGPWGWVAGVAAVLVAAGVGMAFAFSGGDGGTSHVVPPTPAPVVSTTEPTTPTQSGTQSPPAPSTGTRRPQQPTDNGNYSGNNNSGNNNMSPSSSSGKHTQTPTPTGSASHTPTAPSTTTNPPTTAPTTPSTGGGGNTATSPPPPSKSVPPVTAPPVTQPPATP
ncbi:tRNA A-37 threonylcarbamoyl transferase component Bud32/type II secretory pathway pseudopilin PulG [Kitasatospora sp. MAA19]|uniref:protein kinase domain-containing protein n=1 Tax=Kitasatospora sp. MAA19 TaxID=3035090 RepID=UPI002475EBB2|nr:protein kinase [Kitasatospora sp. MAA19]MDH6703627.1 tRNA A-37 threonylcarbamoyl transferase component Bud32/type II secretory pathway pseudopilin PulG [Kitasatospora sp. MAA19]